MKFFNDEWTVTSVKRITEADANFDRDEIVLESVVPLEFEIGKRGKYLRHVGSNDSFMYDHYMWNRVETSEVRDLLVSDNQIVVTTLNTVYTFNRKEK